MDVILLEHESSEVAGFINWYFILVDGKVVKFMEDDQEEFFLGAEFAYQSMEGVSVMKETISGLEVYPWYDRPDAEVQPLIQAELDKLMPGLEKKWAIEAEGPDASDLAQMAEERLP